MKIRIPRVVALVLCLLALLGCAYAAASDFVEIPRNTTVIRVRSFDGASGVAEVVLHDDVTRIESRAFASSGLKHINLPDSVSHIAPDAFDGCEELKALCAEGSYAWDYCEKMGIEIDSPPLVVYILQSEREKTLAEVETALSAAIPETLSALEGRLRLHWHSSADAPSQTAVVREAVRKGADMVLLNLVDAASAGEYAKLFDEAEIPVLYFNAEPAATVVSGHDAVFVGSKNGSRASADSLAEACAKIALNRLKNGEWIQGSGYTSQSGWSVLLDSAYRLAGLKIGIDPGHQRKANSAKEPVAPGSSKKKPKVSSGTYGVYSKEPEYVRVLQISFKLRDALEKMGAEVYMTRTHHDVNISNIQRAQMMNKLEVDLVLRIHCDGSSSSSAHGISIYAKKSGTGAAESQRAARAILPKMISATGAHKRGVKTSNDYTGLNWSTVPSILVECGFMTNKAEDKLLATTKYQQQLAHGMTIGICDYFGR